MSFEPLSPSDAVLPQSPTAAALRDLAVFPATSLDVRAFPVLASLAMQAAEAEYSESESQASNDSEELSILRTISLPNMQHISPSRSLGLKELMVRNTFVEVPTGRSPSLDRFYEERKVQSSPPSGALEVAVPVSPRRGHRRVMSAVEEALVADAPRSQASSSSVADGGPPTVTTTTAETEAGTAVESTPPLSAREDLDSMDLAVSPYIDSAECNTELETYTPADCGFGSPLATPASAGLSIVQYFANTTCAPAALSTEPIVQVPLGSDSDGQLPRATFRREMLRARGAAVVEAAGRRPPGAGDGTDAQMAWHWEAVPSPCLASAAPSTPPGTFVTPTASDSWLSSSSSKAPRGVVSTRLLGKTTSPQPPQSPQRSALQPSQQEAAQESELQDGLPSRGSAMHSLGACKPCAFVFEGCNNGSECQFCHMCEPGERIRRKKEKLALRKEAREDARRRMDRERSKLPWE